MKSKKYLCLSLISVILLSSSSFGADYTSAKLNEIEKYFYGYTNKGSEISRVAQLEKDLYGYGKNTKMSLKNRVDKIHQDMNLGGSTNFQTAANSPAQQSAKNNIGPQADTGIKYPVVDKLEQKVFNKSYENDDIYDRLSRLEKQVFKDNKNRSESLSLNERVDVLRNKLLGDSQIAGVDIDPMREEIILENGQKYLDDVPQYNYYSYEGSKNHISQPATDSYFNDETNGYSQNYDLDVLEKQLFGKRFAQEPPSERLARLESSLFQRTFSDNDEARIQRLLAVTTAQKTSQEYDSNKWARRLNTGIQIGSILLMVLAMIL